MKVAGFAMMLAFAPARPGTCFGAAGWLDYPGDRIPPSGKTSADHMKHRCNCGMKYVVVPREVPLARDEVLICDNCGCKLNGRWSSRYFEYEPFRQFPRNR